MNYLELCQSVARESGTVHGEQLQSVEDQSGRLLKIAIWVQQAWEDIQNSRPNWQWMFDTFQANLFQGNKYYTNISFGINRFARWITKDNSITLYDPLVGKSDEGFLRFIPYEHFRTSYDVGVHDSSKPQVYSVSPLDQICIGPQPDKSYVIRGLYYKSPQVLMFDLDVPEFPSRFHRMIVAKALLYLGEFDEGGFVIQRASRQYAEMSRDLEKDQLDKLVIPNTSFFR